MSSQPTSLSPQLALLPIQNLLALAELQPRLVRLGIRNVEDAWKMLQAPNAARGMLHPDDFQTIEAAINQLIKEHDFCRSFNWDLLAYSPEVQAQFAQKAQAIFDDAYCDTKLIYLSIPTRTLRALENAELASVRDVLAAQPRLMEVRNLGNRSIGELFRILGQFARVYRYMLGNLWSVTQRRLSPQGLIKVVIGPLKDRERDVLVKRYGLEGQEMTLRETGDALGISRERARQIQNRTMEKLREGSSIALIHDWVELHLPHIIHRSMIKAGGLASTQAIISTVSTEGFSLSLVSDVLGIELSEMLKRQELIQAGERLWAINKPFARLCWDAVDAIEAQPISEDQTHDNADFVEQVMADFKTTHTVASRYTPAPSFISLVVRHRALFWAQRPEDA